MGMYIKKNGSLGQIVGAATWQCQWLLQYYLAMKTAIFVTCVIPVGNKLQV